MLLEKINGELGIVSDQFFDLKENAHAKMIKVTQEISDAVSHFNQLNNDSLEKIKQVDSELENVRKNLDKFHLDISQGNEYQHKLGKKIKAMTKDNTLDVKLEEMKNENMEIFKSFDELLSETNHKLYILEEYLDKYMPMKIQSAISGTMGPLLSSKKKKVMDGFVSEKLVQLKSNIANDKQTDLEKKLNMIAKASGRENYIKKPPNTAMGIQGSISSFQANDPKNQDPFSNMFKTANAFNDPKNNLFRESSDLIVKPRKTSSAKDNLEETENIFKQESNAIVLESKDTKHISSSSPSKYLNLKT